MTSNAVTMNQFISRPKVIIRFPKTIHADVRRMLLSDDNEHVCFIFCHMVETENTRIFLARSVMGFSPDCYRRQTPVAAVLDHRAKAEAYARFIRSEYRGLINCHSHPFADNDVRFSDIDDRDDLREFAWFYDQVPEAREAGDGTMHALSMVFGHNSIDARGYVDGNSPSFAPVNTIQILDVPYQLISPTSRASLPSVSSAAPDTSEVYQRQIAAFGAKAQERLANLSVGLVGAGGIGSVLAESVLRLGVRALKVVDADVLDLSNLNRWQGGAPEDVGKPKVVVLHDRLSALFPEAMICPVNHAVQDNAAIDALKDCDLILGGLDNNVARHVLNHIAVQYLIPYIDGATAITSDGSDIGLKAKVAVIIPGITSCLYCSRINHYDREDVSKHLHDPDTQRLLRVSGYIKDHPELKSPAVLPLNMLAAATVLFEAINLVTGFAPLARYIWFDWLHLNGATNRTDEANFPEMPAPDCLFCSGYLGLGDSEVVAQTRQVTIPPCPHLGQPDSH